MNYSTAVKNSLSFEKYWTEIDRKYYKQFGRHLPLKKQIFNLYEDYQNLHETGKLPTIDQLQNYNRFTRIFLSNIVRDIYELRFHELNLHLIIENLQVKESLDDCLIALEAGDYDSSIKKAALAFSLELENERIRLDHWKKTGLYDEMYTYLFLFESPEALAFKLQDYSFILLALGTNIEKFNVFQEIIPVVMLTVGSDAKTSVNIGDFIHEQYNNFDSAYYCYTFVLETILLWQANRESGPPVPVGSDFMTIDKE